MIRPVFCRTALLLSIISLLNLSRLMAAVPCDSVSLSVSSVVYPASACGAADGKIRIAAVNGGTPPYTYSWSTGATTDSIAGISTGHYTVTVTDAGGCMRAEYYTLSVSGVLLTVTAVSITQTTCPESSDGAIKVTTTGGTAPYTYNWSNGATGDSISGLPVGTYSVSVTDADGCFSSEPYSFSVTAAPTVAISGGAHPAYCGANNGKIYAGTSGGTPPYSLVWSTGETSDSIFNLSPGDYTVTGTDANGCTAQQTFTIINNEATIYAYLGSSGEDTCASGKGFINLDIQGNGTPPYSYNWTGPSGFTSTAAGISGLHEGDYFVTVTDANGCTGTNGIHVHNIISTVHAYLGQFSEDTCGKATGSISLNIQGNGTPPFTYNWTGPNGFTSTDAAISGLAAGDYFVTVTDAHGCTGMNGIRVRAVTAPLDILPGGGLLVSTCVDGNNGSIQPNVTAGTPPYVYSWTGPNGFTASTKDISGLYAGLYHISVTDAHGCYDSDTFRVNSFVLDILPGGCVFGSSCPEGTSGHLSPTINAGTPPYTFNWTGPNGFASSLQDLVRIAPGDYTLTITDSKNCRDTHTWNIPAEAIDILPGGGLLTPTCTDGNNGSISPNVTAGTPPYAYQWTGPNGFTANTKDITGLFAGLYRITVTDANGCRDSDTFRVNSFVLDILPGGYVTNGTCAGFARGFVEPTINAGTPPYTYSWTGPHGFTSQAATIHHLRAGNYSLTITDSRNCKDTHTYSVTEYPTPGVNVTTQPARCTGLNGSATAQGFHSPYFYTTYTYAWSHGQTGANATGMAPGNYTVTVTDGNACTASRSFSIGSVQDQIGPTGFFNYWDTCGAGVGSCGFIGNFAGGTAPYQCVWSNGTAGFVNNNLIAGNYSCTVSDANGCTYTTSFPVSSTSSPPRVTGIFSYPDTCGAGVGRCGILSMGQERAPFSYRWSSGETTMTISGKHQGNYQVTITDRYGCTAVQSFGIMNHNAVISLGMYHSGPVTCQARTAVLAAYPGPVSEAKRPVSYAWSNGMTGDTVRNIGPGNYTVTATDAHGCTETVSFLVESNPVSLSAGAYHSGDIPCNGGITTLAAFLSNVSPGTPPYAYRWSNGETRDTIRVNIPGNYECTVTDANGCTGSVAFTVNAQQNTVRINPTVMQPRCHGEKGAISINPAGGLTPHNASWSNGSTSWNLFNLDAGTYSVTVTNGNNCNATGSYVINPAPAELTADVVEDSFNCQGVTHFHANVSGGVTPYTFDWTPGAHQDGSDPRFRFSTASNLMFTCTVTDTNGCTAVDSFMQTKTALHYVIITGDTCPQGGVMRAEPQNGEAPFMYRWSTGAATQAINYTGTGIYYVTVTDANGCTASADKFIRQLAFGHTSTATTCEGAHDGRIDLTVYNNGIPYQIQWTGPNGFTSQQEDISNLYAGMYNFTITYGGGCRMTGSIRVDDAIGNFGLYHTATPTTCQGAHDGAISITPVLTTQYTVAWTGPNGFTSNQQNISGLYAGDYNYVIEDTRGCRKTGTINVQDAIGNFGLYYTPTATTCAGAHDGSITIQPVLHTQYTVQWSGPNGFTSAQQNIYNLYAGNYSVTIEDTRGCRKIQSITVPDAAGNFSVGYTPTATTCRGAHDGSVNLSVYLNHNNYSVQWSGPNGFTSAQEDIANLYAGNYSVTITDQTRGCVKTVNDIRVEDAVTHFAYGVTPTGTTCRGAHNGSVDLFIYSNRPPFNIQWTGPNGFTSASEDISGLYAGVYRYRVEDARGCVIRDSTTVTDAITHFSYGITPHHPSCENSANGWIELFIYSPHRPFHIQWTGPDGFTSASQNINNLRAGTYRYTVEDAIGCRISDSTALTATNGAVNLASEVIKSCRAQNNGAAIIAAAGGTAPYTFRWNNGMTGREIFNLVPGQYSCSVTDANGCSGIIQVSIEETHDCVWPGDANADGIVNKKDILALGHAFNRTGYPRYRASTEWKGQTCDDWAQASRTGVNNKHADCNGNGTVNRLDMEAVRSNYFRTHDRNARNGMPADPLLYFGEPEGDLTPGSAIKVPVYLGTDSIPFTDFYGIVFSIDFDNTVFEEGTVYFEATDSWIGTPGVDMEYFSETFFEHSVVEVAITKTDQSNSSGYGKIGVLNCTIKADFIMEDIYVSTGLSFSNVEAESAEEAPVDVFHEPAEITIIQGPAAISLIDNESVKIYPNPVTEVLYVDITRVSAEEICLMNLYGQCIAEIKHPQTGIVEIGTADLPAGTYLVQAKTKRNILMQRVVVMK
ncbi:MAG TPA: T9SS type A sorting domain-containing protein [Chitinophagales bacterium]|nr:T9SS type A sorting domain-containing protein [Chitinophagales bacterium]